MVQHSVPLAPVASLAPVPLVPRAPVPLVQNPVLLLCQCHHTSVLHIQENRQLVLDMPAPLATKTCKDYHLQ